METGRNVDDIFLPSGLLNYVQDTNGNRITVGYNPQNQLIALTYSNPATPAQPSEQLAPVVGRIAARLGRKPRQMLADGDFTNRRSIAAMAELGVD